MVSTCREQQTHKAAHSAGKHHGANDHSLYLYARIACGALALAHYGDFIAVFAVLKVYICKHSHHCHNKNCEQVLLTRYLRQPASIGILVDYAYLTCSLGHFPDDDVIRRKLCCYVVHHQREQRFVGIPARLEEGGQEAPQCAGGYSRNYHYEDEKAVGQLIAEADHAGGGGEAAYEHLTLRAYVPEAHLECGGDSKGYAEQHREILEGNPSLTYRAECTVEYGAVNAYRVLARHEHCNQRADYQRKQYCTAAYSRRDVPWKRAALCDME